MFSAYEKKVQTVTVINFTTINFIVGVMVDIFTFIVVDCGLGTLECIKLQ
jgi:hypothetical protein